jgi:myo-inositol-1(or 4)-monophosphatase
MPYSMEHLKAVIVSAAKEELLPRFENVERRYKADKSVVTEADLVMQERIVERLTKQWPETTVLGEEMFAQEQQEMLAGDAPVWCLDPVDGTGNFVTGIPYFCVSLALIHKGKVQLGVVYDPMRDEFFAASQENGASLNGKPLQLQESGLRLSQSIALVDFKRLKRDLATRLVSHIPYASQRSFGSVALDWCWLAAGRGHVYLHGRSHIWDYAAGNFIFHAAGGHSSTLQGEAIFVDALKPRSAVAAVDASLFAEWTTYLGVPRN